MRLCIFWFALLTVVLSHAQGLSDTDGSMSSFNSGGSQASSSSGSISYSIGQVFFTTVENNAITVAQGIQQPLNEDGSITLQLPQAESKIQITAYPNPTIDHLIIQLGDLNGKNYTFKLFNMNGKVLKENELDQRTNRINSSALASATYLLQIYKDEKPVKSLKIIKK